MPRRAVAQAVGEAVRRVIYHKLDPFSLKVKLIQLDASHHVLVGAGWLNVEDMLLKSQSRTTAGPEKCTLKSDIPKAPDPSNDHPE